MNHHANIFSSRLRELCDQEESYAKVAREIGISRQQLSRYLSGSTMPRDGVLSALSNYFSVPVSDLFSETPFNHAEGTNPHASLDALSKILMRAQFEEITDSDLEEGFYKQYKRPYCDPDSIFYTISMVKKIKGVYYYKRRTSVTYCRRIPLTGGPQNVFEGVFFKQGNNLVLFDCGSSFGDVTMHVLDTSNHYDRNTKHGYHSCGAHKQSNSTQNHRFILRKIDERESILELARQQGFRKFEEVPSDIQSFFME